ncbi:MAG: hypothetical protein R2932_24340 [Caldilineaceae bacterium]
MSLLYLAVSYFIGIFSGRLLWQIGWVGCDFPAYGWLLPLLLTPFTPLVNQLEQLAGKRRALRWPEVAGFEPPRTAPSPALLVACGLCLCAGAMRYPTHPITPCWGTADLAYYNLPATKPMIERQQKSSSQATLAPIRCVKIRANNSRLQLQQLTGMAAIRNRCKAKYG